ncbi:MAG TPA: cobalamin-binding protein [Nitrosopumilaceae archaeon]|nr:cobalamin-binding protein [Nitrosopumilaceae archaeon]
MVQRIVSFLPSATELIYELGCQDKLFGVTHECLYPEDAKSKPKVINTVIDGNSMSSPEIDKKTCELMKHGKDIFILDENNLKKASPDLIVCQNTCEVCAAHTNQIEQAFLILEKKPQIHSIDPHNLEQILESIVTLSKLVGREKKGKLLQESLKERIEFVRSHTFDAHPKVLALEWIKPFFTSGHWVPEMIGIAGGINLVSKVGEHSRRMEMDEVTKADPDIIILMPCGFDTNRTISEYKLHLKDDKSWNELKAVQNKNVYAVDANSYFSKPSIRTITGLEILAKILHPVKFDRVNTPKNSFKKIR